jgi:tripartite-type tricarboxylate transporter receptor subunit TctC
MKLSRRQVIQLPTALVALPFLARSARAEIYPSRPVRIIVGFPAGGVGDILARLIGQWLAQHFGHPFVVENRPGAGGNVAAEMAAIAPADGYTLLSAGVNYAINAALYEKQKFNFIRDFAPVASIVRVPNVVVVHPSFPARTLPEFIAHSRANQGKINMASAGNGTSAHVAGELFKIMAGVDLVHVPYRGGAPAVAALLGNQVHVYFGPVSETIEHVRAGSLRALAVTSSGHLEALAGTPAVAEFLPGFEASGWQGIVAPRDTPNEIVIGLNKRINAGLADPKIGIRLAELGGMPLSSSPNGFAALIAAETEKWGKVVRAAKIKPA